MKNLGTRIGSIFLALVLLAGCSAPKSMTLEEVQQYFQSVFDSGQRENATDDQVAEELEQLKAIAENNRSFPSDYEEQYLTWREEQVQAIRKAATTELQQAYTQVVDSYPLYDGLSAGLIYADYLDMDQDGMDELLVLSATGGEINMNSVIKAQVYTGVEGQASLCGEVSLEIYSGKADSRISIYKKDNQLFLSTYGQDDASAIPTYIHYYGLDGSSLVLEDELFSSYGWVDGEEWKVPIYEPENFLEIAAQYTLVKDLFTYNSVSGPSYTRGILQEPEVSIDVQRRIAFLDILNKKDNLIYADLLDINQDGQEDLLTLYEQNHDNTGVTSYYFCSYVWDGQQVQEVDLSQVGNEEIDSYLSIGFGIYGLYRRTDSGQLYACYDGEIVGGWGGTLFVDLLNPADYEFCGYPFIASDYSAEFYTPEEAAELEAQYAQEENAYNAFMGRYELVKQIYEQWGQDVNGTIQFVINELETI